MKHIKKILITTLTFLSLELYAGWFSPEIVICDQTDKVQMRRGVLYLPNQSDGFTGLNSCIYTKNEQQASIGDYLDGLKDGKWTSWHENGQKLSEKSYKDGRLTPNEYSIFHKLNNYEDKQPDGLYDNTDFDGNPIENRYTLNPKNKKNCIDTGDTNFNGDPVWFCK